MGISREEIMTLRQTACEWQVAAKVSNGKRRNLDLDLDLRVWVFIAAASVETRRKRTHWHFLCRFFERLTWRRSLGAAR